jgi:hypothetical protein
MWCMLGLMADLVGEWATRKFALGSEIAIEYIDKKRILFNGRLRAPASRTGHSFVGRVTE